MNLNFSDLIRYFLSSIVIAKSWEYHTQGHIEVAIKQNELFFYLALGIVSYNIYRSLIYESIFANLQDLLFWILMKWNKRTLNYRFYLKKELNVSKQKGKKIFNIINREYLSKMKSSGDFITASSIHFFYMSSIIFLAFTLLNIYSGKLIPFLIATITSILVGVISDISYEQKELRLIKELLRSERKTEVKKMIENQLKGLKKNS